MAIMSATRADVFSNARVKLYPSTQVLQVANESIFRAAGWEARTREYDVPPKGRERPPPCYGGQPCPCKSCRS